MLLFAPHLKNPGHPPISDAAIGINQNIIEYAGPREGLPKKYQKDPDQYEIEDAVLFPGFVNAHCHLELTALEGLSNPGLFTDWIRNLLKAKNALSVEDQKKSLTQGVLASILGGATTLGDHISFNGDLESLLNSPLRGKVFIEVLGVIPEVAKDILKAALSLRQLYTDHNPRFEILPSPHSVHALAPEVLEKLLKKELPLYSIHLAESIEEKEYFQNNSGPFQKFISERGESLNRKASSGIEEIKNSGFLDQRILAIHGNYLENDHFVEMGKKGISIVHCPLSHQYFKHRPFPVVQAIKDGVNLALGTDSLASATSLSMFEVIRQAEKNFNIITKEAIFSMATLGGAKALKMEGEIGEIVTGKKADIVGVQCKTDQDPIEAIFNAEKAEFFMADGVILAG